MTEKQEIKLQRWWMEQIREITRKVMADEERRVARSKAKAAKELADFCIERRKDIDDLYGYGTITEKKRDKLIDLFDQVETAGELYQEKLDLLQDCYTEAQNVLRDMGQEV